MAACVAPYFRDLGRTISIHAKTFKLSDHMATVKVYVFAATILSRRMPTSLVRHA